jgi:hypothetical protein
MRELSRKASNESSGGEEIPRSAMAKLRKRLAGWVRGAGLSTSTSGRPSRHLGRPNADDVMMMVPKLTCLLLTMMNSVASVMTMMVMPCFHYRYNDLHVVLRNGLDHMVGQKGIAGFVAAGPTPMPVLPVFLVVGDRSVPRRRLLRPRRQVLPDVPSHDVVPLPLVFLVRLV